uniref:Uncharacterized protein n=1 Tax=Arundo donax TaxID=35708 RepID=A0A0A8Z4H8_ARUDO
MRASVLRQKTQFCYIQFFQGDIT